ncbi:hypothetical protein HOI83_01985 [Candidatus Uhrbacteria bacterium]|jgi:hypothetical protein|nr:hypothetical protein [Candidatus Uhrbacteria bacterium]
MNDLLRTVSYFTSIGQSLSAFHVWQYLYRPSREWSVGEVKKALEDARALSERDGRFVLKGYEEIFDKEHDMYLDSDRKFRKARRIASLVSMIPGVRAVSVCNSLAWESTKRKSDTDFLVICRPGRLWLARFLAVGPLILLRRRPGERAVDPVDFTFFVSDRALDLSSLAIDGEDPYLAYWVASLIPLIDDGVISEFCDRNAWVREILPNVSWRELARFRKPRAVGLPFSVPHGALGWLEQHAKRLSHKRFPEQIRSKMNKSSHVIVNDDMLKFHVHDDRVQIRDNWQKIYEQLS